MLKALALVPYPRDGASARLRVHQMVPELRRLGIDLEVRPFHDDAAFARLHRHGQTAHKLLDLARGMRRRWAAFQDARRYAVTLVHREAWPLVGFDPGAALRRRGVRWAFDFDDAVFLPNVSAANRRFGGLKPFGQAAQLVRDAGAVAAGNGWLADWARAQRPGGPPADVQVVPTAVDVERWAPRPRAEGPPRLAWIGSEHTVAHLHGIAPVLERLARRHRGLELHVVGAPFSCPGIAVREHRWSLETEVDLVAQGDVGLSPLADSDWTRGKCGLKLLQYMAAGLPAVASPVGAHRDIVRHGENGLLADTPERFEAAVDALLSDPELRARIGAAARETVRACYSVTAVAPRLAAVLQRAAGGI